MLRASLLLIFALLSTGCGEPRTEPKAAASESSAMPEMPELPVVAPQEAHFQLAHLLKPDMDAEVGIDPYLAPLLYLEGEAHAQLSPREVWYADERVLHGDHEHRQLLFVWLRDLPSATAVPQYLRVTCARDGYPALYEVASGPNGTPAQWTVQSLEAAAPLAGAQLVERIADGPAPTGPYVYLGEAREHVLGMHCRCSPSHVDVIAGDASYTLRPLVEGALPVELALPAPERPFMLFDLPADF